MSCHHHRHHDLTNFIAPPANAPPEEPLVLLRSPLRIEDFEPPAVLELLESIESGERLKSSFFL